MRRFYLKSQGPENKGATAISDENHDAKYWLVGKWGLKDDALSVYDLNGQQLAELKQRSVGSLPKFELFLADQVVGTVTTPIGFVRGLLYVHQLHWFITGDTVTCHFKVRHKMTTILKINRVQINNSNYIELVVYADDAPQIPLFICLATILDRWIQKRPPLQEPKLVRSWKIKSDATGYNNFSKEHQNANQKSFNC
jgi:uncharacterized protein YxjI